MNWATEQRMLWITEMLEIYGFISRVHLTRKFRISPQQVSTDFNRFMETNPEAMIYDVRKKIYVATSAPAGLVEKL